MTQHDMISKSNKKSLKILSNNLELLGSVVPFQSEEKTPERYELISQFDGQQDHQTPETQSPNKEVKRLNQFVTKVPELETE